MISVYGKILADAMGLGKTVMTIALLLANPGRGGSVTQEPQEKRIRKNRYSIETRNTQNKGGGTLIVCPMTLLGQWKVCIHILTSTTNTIFTLPFIAPISGLHSFLHRQKLKPIAKKEHYPSIPIMAQGGQMMPGFSSSMML